ncbi:enoyl-CoA hydratase [Variovorax sp. WS11]|uniref:enoyl-CoA hydratase/isomerase family protein n=1 Tax=Variovorax sp. WS11 TaxID=1105204 RepID=UPI000D0D82E5|nr:enoyl-CoA hydratase/isomerase family protein [Variovorax sp. WS11]NDZ18855.1 enoyl-CoA hydratase/isomerase family protein [Variovorax sp. WS11]PSL79074.1 enoyl-CoA hydratase [Variovorax sp. WS11]
MESIDVTVVQDDHVAIVELQRPPNNFLDVDLIGNLATTLEELDQEPLCRCIVLAAAGKHFCAGGNLKQRMDAEVQGETVVAPGRHIYKEARRLVQTRKPIVAAVHGSAIGAGLGLAAAADFRVTCKEARFAANFTAIGFHPGFGLTITLPRLIGQQQARWMLLTGARITGDRAFEIGLADRLVGQDEVRAVAVDMARQIAEAAPLAVQATRASLNADLVAEFRSATERESFEQNWLRETQDYQEGVLASHERRKPVFKGS